MPVVCNDRCRVVDDVAQFIDCGGSRCGRSDKFQLSVLTAGMWGRFFSCLHTGTGRGSCPQGHGSHNEVHSCSGIDKDTSVTPGPHHNHHNHTGPCTRVKGGRVHRDTAPIIRCARLWWPIARDLSSTSVSEPQPPQPQSQPQPTTTNTHHTHHTHNGFPRGVLLDIHGSMQLFNSAHVGERDKALLRSVTAEHVQMTNFQEGLVRIMNVAGDSEIRTPSLGDAVSFSGPCTPAAQ